MRRAALAALFALLTTSVAVGQAPAPPPPNAIAPLFTANVPALFQWTAVNPGTVYNLIVAQRGRNPQAVALPPVNYELQIGDRLDIASHVLFDITVTQPSFLFTDRYVPNSGFTNNQPFGVPLSGGTYYWRVRGIVGGLFTAFTNPQQFVLNLPAGGGGATPIHAMGITGLAVAGQPIVSVGGAVLFVLQNLGTYAESNVPYLVTVNGTKLFGGVTGPLSPGQSVQVSTQWIPAQKGVALVGAQLTFAGATQARTTSTLTVIVDEQAALLTTIVGNVRRVGPSYVLADNRDRALAVLVPAAGATVDFPSYVDQHVSVQGSLTKTGDGYLFAVKTINTSR